MLVEGATIPQLPPFLRKAHPHCRATLLIPAQERTSWAFVNVSVATL
jgi:hypothetical protein